jgi:hypothetical protein
MARPRPVHADFHFVIQQYLYITLAGKLASLVAFYYLGLANIQGLIEGFQHKINLKGIIQFSCDYES